MQPIKPAPVEYVPGTDDHEEWFAYRDAMDDYMFHTRWLQIALTPAEYAKVAGLSTSLLKELYPDIRLEGPMGAVWFTQLRHMLKIFNGEIDAIKPSGNPDEVNALVFVDDFISTYQRENLRELMEQHKDLWQRLRDRTDEDHNTNALMPDVDAYMDTLPHQVRVSKLMNKLNRLTPDRYFQFADALEEHAKVTLLSYLLRKMPESTDLMARHDTFVSRYRLLDPIN